MERAHPGAGGEQDPLKEPQPRSGPPAAGAGAGVPGSAPSQAGAGDTVYPARRTLAIQEETLGPDHTNAGTSINNLGLVLQAQGKYDEARRHYERALAIREKALGPDHPHVAASLNKR